MPTISGMHSRDTTTLLRCLGIRRTGGRTISSLLSGVDQAAAVMACLRRDALVPAVLLLGRPITVCPPARQFSPFSMPDIASPEGDDRRVSRVSARNPYMPTSRIHEHFGLWRPGLTIRMYLARGGRRREVREALQMGYVSLRK